MGTSQVGDVYPINAEKLVFFQLYYQISKKAAAAALKVMSDAVVLVNLYGSSPKDLTALLRSPNYPQQYPEMSTFVWIVKTLPGYKLVFEIYDLDIDECCGNLTLYDGGTRTSSVIAVLSGSFLNGTAKYESGYNALLIQFESKALVKKRGFDGNITVDYDLLHFPDIMIIFENKLDHVQHVALKWYLSETLQVLSHKFGSEENMFSKRRSLYMPSKCIDLRSF